MKRILCLTLFICSLASSCFASAHLPYFPRWYPVSANDQIRMFIDQDTGRWEIDKEGLWGHKGHAIATVWVMFHYIADDEYFLHYGLWCLDCKTYEQLRTASYNSDGKFEGASWYESINKITIPNGTKGEFILNALKRIWETKK